MYTRAQIESLPCNLCQSERFKVLFTKLGLSIVRCQACGLIYANPRLIEPEMRKRYSATYFFSEYLPAFKADASSYPLELIKNHYVLFLDLLAKYFIPGKSLLDIGCGAGFFLKAAESMGWRVSGTEISEAAFDYARRVTNIQAYLGRLEDISLPSQSYDIVTMLDILEHLPDPSRTLQEVHGILKKRGILIISTPDFQSLSRLFLGKGWAVLSPVEHLYYFTQKTLLRALQQTGYRVIGVRNLLNFIPDYTHHKTSLRSSLWKDSLRRLEKTRIMQNIHVYEYYDLLFTGDDQSLNPLIAKIHSAPEKKIFQKAKAWLRGDSLVAIVQKD
jgi:2-polyprenyl-3-methyl-5-hydroxy-6-metoxy-1,4-benzoquinol methylase